MSPSVITSRSALEAWIISYEDEGDFSHSAEIFDIRVLAKEADTTSPTTTIISKIDGGDVVNITCFTVREVRDLLVEMPISWRKLSRILFKIIDK